MTKKMKTPHDAFFQSMMEDLEVAQSFFQAYLPAQLVQAIDWGTLAIADSVRRAPGNKPLYTDITYQCLSKGKLGHIYLHVEQERGIDNTMLERTFQYNAGLFLKHRKQGHKKLPLVINLVLYNGMREDYPYFEDIYEYFEQPALARAVLVKPFILINLNNQPDEALVEHGPVGLMELLLKRASRANFLLWMREHKALARSLPAFRYLSQVIDYVFEVGQGKAEEIIATFVSVYPELKETVMTAAQQLRREGMKQGMQTRNLEIARNMLLNLHLGMDVVQKATGLSREALQDLQAASKE